MTPLLKTLGLGTALMVLPAVGSATVLDEAVSRAFEQRGIDPDTNTVHRLALEAIVKAVDAQGRIVSRAEATRLLKAPSVSAAEEWPEALCYLRIDGLFEGGGTAVVARVRDWARAGKAGVILDIRGAGGDSVESAYTIAGSFAAAGITARGGPPQAAGHTVLQSGPDGPEALPVEVMMEAGYAIALPEAVPVMLIVDADTHGAAELLAAIMKEQGGVLLIGSRTCGDGALREVLPLTADEGLYLITRRIVSLRPDAGAFSGVEPDLVVSDSDRGTPPLFPERERPGKTLSEKAALNRELMQRVAGDAALVRATDILLGLKALALYGTSTNSADSAGQGD